MKNRLKFALASLGAGGAFALGILVVLLLLASFQRGRQLLLNPFGFSTKITPSGPVVLEQLQRISRLETALYTGHTIVKGDTSSGILPNFIAGDRLVFIGHGEVVAGVDLSEMKPEDVETKDGVVTLHLPPAKIFRATLDNAQSEVFERQTGLFSKPDSQLETRVRQEAEARIRAAAEQSGIIKHAELGAQEALRKPLEMLGFKEFHFR